MPWTSAWPPPSTPTNAARRRRGACSAPHGPTPPGGRLLGPDAVAAALEQLRGTEAEVLVRPSPWRLGAADADLTAAWLDGWVAAACEQDRALAAEAGAYRDRRLAQAAAGELAVAVHHADLLV